MAAPKMTDTPRTADLPIIIIGAGISGLLLAQQLRKTNTPYQIFERDSDFSARGDGWGLTLHWSLPALRTLLPLELLTQLPDTYVDRAAVERGESSTFPFYDLSTGLLRSSSPRAEESQRIRVTRERFRKLLATDIDVKWGKSFVAFREEQDWVEAVFEDDTVCRGRLVVGCDGSRSKVRQAVCPNTFATHQIMVRLFGFTRRVGAKEAERIRELDPFFLQGTASSSNVFMYLSLLEAPQQSSSSNEDRLYQICISWSKDQVPPAIRTLKEPSDNANRIETVRAIAQQWAEPFKSFITQISDTTKIKQLDLEDFAPRPKLRSTDKVILVGDAFHAMSMYRGEGANHTIVDVLDLSEKVLSHLNSTSNEFHEAIQDFEDALVARTRPAVLASRKACLDAHDWHGLTANSPLLTRRQMHLDFDG
ncbi:FAD binding domain-containing protein [Phaeosphaeria sp. MPI-PUGE-AT-0046c]|nr:FAD binding domain-containing protein [Phaeosphaeria sp. MPI-PUGE-AT-0046c]